MGVGLTFATDTSHRLGGRGGDSASTEMDTAYRAAQFQQRIVRILGFCRAIFALPGQQMASGFAQGQAVLDQHRHAGNATGQRDVEVAAVAAGLAQFLSPNRKDFYVG